MPTHTIAVEPTGLPTRIICDEFYLTLYTHHSECLNSFRSVRNFVIDVRQMPSSTSATGLHWQVAQATSLINIFVEMSTAKGNNHQGIVPNNGVPAHLFLTHAQRYFYGKWQRWIHGWFVTPACSVLPFYLTMMLDITFNGGKFGIWVGNQQCVDFVLRNTAILLTTIIYRFTVRNITVNNAESAIFCLWNWGESKVICSVVSTDPILRVLPGWTFQGVTINNCQVRYRESSESSHRNAQTGWV